MRAESCHGGTAARRSGRVMLMRAAVSAPRHALSGPFCLKACLVSSLRHSPLPLLRLGSAAFALTFSSALAFGPPPTFAMFACLPLSVLPPASRVSPSPALAHSLARSAVSQSPNPQKASAARRRRLPPAGRRTQRKKRGLAKPWSVCLSVPLVLITRCEQLLLPLARRSCPLDL